MLGIDWIELVSLKYNLNSQRAGPDKRNATPASGNAHGLAVKAQVPESMMALILTRKTGCQGEKARLKRLG